MQRSNSERSELFGTPSRKSEWSEQEATVSSGERSEHYDVEIPKQEDRTGSNQEHCIVILCEVLSHWASCMHDTTDKLAAYKPWITRPQLS